MAFQVSYLAKPVILLPLPICYPIGLVRGVLPTKVVMGTFLIIAFLSFGSILHMFGYRYEVARGTKRLFPAYILAIMAFGYSCCLVPPLAIFIGDQQYSAVIEMLRNVRNVTV